MSWSFALGFHSQGICSHGICNLDIVVVALGSPIGQRPNLDVSYLPWPHGFSLREAKNHLGTPLFACSIRNAVKSKSRQDASGDFHVQCANSRSKAARPDCRGIIHASNQSTLSASSGNSPVNGCVKSLRLRSKCSAESTNSA